MGLDYLIDTNLTPWLLEVNSTPSLAVDHSDPEGDEDIDVFPAWVQSHKFHTMAGIKMKG